MKFALVFAAVLAVSAALPPAALSKSPSNRVARWDQADKLLRYENEANPDGSYRYNVQISNGFTAKAQGTPRDFGGNPPVVPVVSQGSFSWTSPEGQRIDITYIADENGYQPSRYTIGISTIHYHSPPSDFSASIKEALSKFSELEGKRNITS